MSRPALLPAKGAAGLTTQALGSAWCLLSSCRPDALLWLNNPFSTSTRVSIKMTKISAPLPQSDKCLLAQQSFLTSYNSFCFVLATGTALWCLLLLKNNSSLLMLVGDPIHPVGDPIHPEGVGPAGLSGSLPTQTILRLSAGAAAGSAGRDACAGVCLQSCLVYRLGFLSFGKKLLVPILPLPPLPDDCRFCEVTPT